MKRALMVLLIAVLLISAGGCIGTISSPQTSSQAPPHTPTFNHSPVPTHDNLTLN